MRLVPDTPEISVGRTLLVVARWTVAWIVAPCRIVYTTAEDDRAGFAYGTVEGHPEEGEESFHVERRSGGAVFFVVATYFRFADPIARLGGPVSGRIQARYTSRYLGGLAEAGG